MAAERLQKLLARAGYGSRRSAEALISAGRVAVDGRAARLGERADPASQRIEVDGKPLPGAAAAVTLMLHKLEGVIVTASDERGRRTVYDLLPDAPPGLRYVGRLDRDSAGLLMMTSDGELAHRLAHPRFRVRKVYEATIEGRPSREALARLRSGVELDDGPTAPAEVDLIETGARSRLRIAIHEGRKRQLRRMLRAVGHRVVRLIRTSVGGVELGNLPAGSTRALTATEVQLLRRLVGLEPGGLDARDGTSISSTAGSGQEVPIPSDSIAQSVAIDGPTASGKSVVSRTLAERLSLGFFDTGLMYRTCTLAVLRAGVDPEDAAAVTELVRSLDIDVSWPDSVTPHVLLEGEDVTGELRGAEVEHAVSLVSRIPAVREELVRRQRALAERQPIVMAGRDIGTRVLTEARTKVFLEASLEVRARRRLGEEINAGRDSTFAQVLQETRRRDELDATGKRAIRREQAAPDALVIDTDAYGIEQVVQVCFDAYRAANPDG